MNLTNEIVIVRSLLVYVAWFVIASLGIGIFLVTIDLSMATNGLSVLSLLFILSLIVVYSTYLSIEKIFPEKSHQFVISVSALINTSIVCLIISWSSRELGVTSIITLFYALFVELPRFGFFSDSIDPSLIQRSNQYFAKTYHFFITGYFVYSIIILLLGFPGVTIPNAILLILSNALFIILGWIIAKRLNIDGYKSRMIRILKLEGLVCTFLLLYAILHNLVDWIAP